ncbi:MAG: hypothetical protein M3454_12560 [Actinomycetota bacterium]|nr:hypothetical protein [Actinomycetota bacterium]
MSFHHLDPIAASDRRDSIAEAGGVLAQNRLTHALAEHDQVVFDLCHTFSRFPKKRREMGHAFNIGGQSANISVDFPIFAWMSPPGRQRQFCAGTLPYEELLVDAYPAG